MKVTMPYHIITTVIITMLVAFTSCKVVKSPHTIMVYSDSDKQLHFVDDKSGKCQEKLLACEDQRLQLEKKVNDIKDEIKKSNIQENQLINKKEELEVEIKALQFQLDNPNEPVPHFPRAIACYFGGERGTVVEMFSKFSHCNGAQGALAACLKTLVAPKREIQEQLISLKESKENVAKRIQFNKKLDRKIFMMKRQLKKKQINRNNENSINKL